MAILRKISVLIRSVLSSLRIRSPWPIAVDFLGLSVLYGRWAKDILWIFGSQLLGELNERSKDFMLVDLHKLLVLRDHTVSVTADLDVVKDIPPSYWTSDETNAIANGTYMQSPTNEDTFADPAAASGDWAKNGPAQDTTIDWNQTYP